jgi:hypothetical protein
MPLFMTLSHRNDCMDHEELAIVEEEGGTKCCHPAGTSCAGPTCCCAEGYCCNDGAPGPDGPTGGGRTGPQLRAVNQVADAVRAEYPRLRIDTFAYEQTAWPPRKTKPAPNVIVRVATETANFERIVNQTADRTADYLRSWADISAQLSIWDYTANYEYNSLIPNPDWFTVVPNRQFEAQEAKVVGYYAEGSTYTSPGRDLSELWIYLNAKAMWDTSRDSDALIASFMARYYGAAAPHVYEYMNAMLAHSRETGQWCHDIGGCSGQYYSPTAGFLTPGAVLRGTAAFEKARAAVATEPKLLTRVDRAKLPVLFVLLLRWEEIRAAAGPAGSATAWPPGAAAYLGSKALAFAEYGRAANLTAFALRCHYVDGGHGRGPQRHRAAAIAHFCQWFSIRSTLSGVRMTSADHGQAARGQATTATSSPAAAPPTPPLPRRAASSPCRTPRRSGGAVVPLRRRQPPPLAGCIGRRTATRLCCRFLRGSGCRLVRTPHRPGSRKVSIKIVRIELIPAPRPP